MKRDDEKAMDPIDVLCEKVRAAKENGREDLIQSALDQRGREGTLRELATIYDVSRSTLGGRAREGKMRQRAHEDYQALTPGMKEAPKGWVDAWDGRGFPARPDLFKAFAVQLEERRA